MICTGETYKKVVKLTLPKDAQVKDPAKLFNSSLAGGTRRAIDIHENEKIDETAFKTLIRAAIALNTDVPSKHPVSHGTMHAARSHERTPNSLSIDDGRPNPNVEIARGARPAMRRKRVRPNDQIISFGGG